MSGDNISVREINGVIARLLDATEEEKQTLRREWMKDARSCLNYLLGDDLGTLRAKIQDVAYKIEEDILMPIDMIENGIPIEED